MHLAIVFLDLFSFKARIKSGWRHWLRSTIWLRDSKLLRCLCLQTVAPWERRNFPMLEDPEIEPEVESNRTAAAVTTRMRSISGCRATATAGLILTCLVKKTTWNSRPPPTDEWLLRPPPPRPHPFFEALSPPQSPSHPRHYGAEPGSSRS